MKVLLVNTYDTGGAAKACIRLHTGLLKKGEASKLLLLESKNINIPNSEVFKATPSRKTFLQKVKHKLFYLLKEFKLLKDKPSKKQLFIKSRTSELEWFSFPDTNVDITQSELYKQADIINLHWVSDFLDFESFFKKNKKPVVWTLHDMNPFSGGEHFTEKYLGINKEGFPIERKISKDEKRVFHQILEYKSKALQGVSNLHIVVLCNWMQSEVKNSQLFKKYPTYLIPNGIDSNIFQPRGKENSRELLNLPKKRKIILFVANHINNNRKGFDFLKRAIQKIDLEDVLLCSIGFVNNTFSEKNKIVELGNISDERLMSVAYSAADVFVIPSLMDNLPNTILESLMCGTPVVGFPVGGIIDLVEDGKNGFLTKEISVISLVEAINSFFSKLSTFNTTKIREDALKKYDSKIQAKRYSELFEKILEV